MPPRKDAADWQETLIRAAHARYVLAVRHHRRNQEAWLRAMSDLQKSRRAVYIQNGGVIDQDKVVGIPDTISGTILQTLLNIIYGKEPEVPPNYDGSNLEVAEWPVVQKRVHRDSSYAILAAMWEEYKGPGCNALPKSVVLGKIRPHTDEQVEEFNHITRHWGIWKAKDTLITHELVVETRIMRQEWQYALTHKGAKACYYIFNHLYHPTVHAEYKKVAPKHGQVSEDGNFRAGPVHPSPLAFSDTPPDGVFTDQPPRQTTSVMAPVRAVMRAPITAPAHCDPTSAKKSAMLSYFSVVEKLPTPRQSQHQWEAKPLESAAGGAAAMAAAMTAAVVDLSSADTNTAEGRVGTLGLIGVVRSVSGSSTASIMEGASGLKRRISLDPTSAEKKRVPVVVDLCDDDEDTVVVPVPAPPASSLRPSASAVPLSPARAPAVCPALAASPTSSPLHSVNAPGCTPAIGISCPPSTSKLLGAGSLLAKLEALTKH